MLSVFIQYFCRDKNIGRARPKVLVEIKLKEKFFLKNRGDILVEYDTRKDRNYYMKLPKNYEPKEYEANIYALWEEQEAFAPQKRGSDETYSMVIPPPNANGDLHMGHGLTLAIEDIAIRYHRMKGEATLFVPGADHAGFETQTVYEKKLAKEGKSRFDFSREELYSQIWDFVEQNKDNYQTQLRRLGASLSWEHFTYTLDEKVVNQAYATFKKMWDDKLIYRGERLVNYCTFHGTGFADIEVEYKEKQGSMWSLRYPLTNSTGSIIVATTRPETMLGDVAVAVHPDDSRYQEFVGKTIKLPLTQREIPIIADEFVDPNFGTGAVKITPAHDFNDYEAGKRHDLPMITVIGNDGRMNHNTPEKYHGLTVAEAREQVVKDLGDLGLLVEVNDHVNNVGHCYKCGTIIEPLLKEQWFIDMKPLAERAIRSLEADEIELFPVSRKTQLIRYLENLQDWNISRQIAWGIPIPAFQNADDPNDWIFDTRVGQHILEIDGKTYHRDPDVFDTWFSSSSWPYITMDYPDGENFKQCYPLSLMETGFDILYPWVSRMLMLGLYVTGEVPFGKVYLHGLIQDEHGAKMSKSKGNVISPMEKIDQFGSDAFRMGIIADESPASSRPYDESKIIGARNFCNKLWNIARFIEGTLGEELNLDVKPEPQTIADHWIIDRLNAEGKRITQCLENYRFAEGYEAIYHLVWDDVADWYVEASKTTPNAAVLNYVLETILKLAHPYAPFVSETIWQLLYGEHSGILAIASWPTSTKTDSAKVQKFEEIKTIVSEVRHIKTLLLLNGGLLQYIPEKNSIFEEYTELIRSLSRLENIEESSNPNGVQLTQSSQACWLDVPEETTRQFVKELQNKTEDLTAQIEKLEKRLANTSYIEKAPVQLVEETRTSLASLSTELELTKEQIKRFAG